MQLLCFMFAEWLSRCAGGRVEYGVHTPVRGGKEIHGDGFANFIHAQGFVLTCRETGLERKIQVRRLYCICGTGKLLCSETVRLGENEARHDMEGYSRTHLMLYECWFFSSVQGILLHFHVEEKITRTKRDVTSIYALQGDLFRCWLLEWSCIVFVPWLPLYLRDLEIGSIWKRESEASHASMSRHGQAGVGTLKSALSFSSFLLARWHT